MIVSIGEGESQADLQAFIEQEGITESEDSAVLMMESGKGYVV